MTENESRCGASRQGFEGLSDTIEFRLAHRVRRMQEAAATSDGHASSVLRILLSDIVKRKHIRSKDGSGKGLRDAARRPRQTVPFGSGLLEHLSRGPRLTARLPDVFEAKLVFSTGGRRLTGFADSVGRRALFGYENNQVS
jgi:hypothetical protein